MRCSGSLRTRVRPLPGNAAVLVVDVARRRRRLAVACGAPGSAVRGQLSLRMPPISTFVAFASRRPLRTAMDEGIDGIVLAGPSGRGKACWRSDYAGTGVGWT